MTIDEMRKMANSKPRRRKPHGEEHRIQASCVRWFRLKHPQMMHNLFAVPNGGRRDAQTGARLKAEGVLPGVADLILLESNRYYGALLIEMKTSSRGSGQSGSQRWWQGEITKDGYKYVVCRSLEEFITEIEDYLGQL